MQKSSNSQTTKLRDILDKGYECFAVWIKEGDGWEFIIVDRERNPSEYLKFSCRSGLFTMSEKFKDLPAVGIELPKECPYDA